MISSIPQRCHTVQGTLRAFGTRRVLYKSHSGCFDVARLNADDLAQRSNVTCSCLDAWNLAAIQDADGRMSGVL